MKQTFINASEYRELPLSLLNKSKTKEVSKCAA